MAVPTGPGGGGDVYVEFIVQGGFVKVTAIHAATGTEASVMGPAGSPRAPLADAAVRKLSYILKKKSGGS